MSAQLQQTLPPENCDCQPLLHLLNMQCCIGNLWQNTFKITACSTESIVPGKATASLVESNNKSSITPFCCIVFSQDPGKETTSIHFFMVFVSSVCNEMSLQARIMNNLLLSVFQFLHFPARRNSH